MKRKILVLEDEENIRSFLVLNLKRSGYEVIEAETGEMALEKYHENQDIAVAVLDVMLPGIDGIELLRRMKSSPELDSIPVVSQNEVPSSKPRASRPVDCRA